MKAIKKILSVVVACCLLLTMAVVGVMSASAADAEPLAKVASFTGNPKADPSDAAKAAFAAVDPNMGVVAAKRTYTGPVNWFQAAQIQAQASVFAGIPDDSTGIAFYVYVDEESNTSDIQMKLTAETEVYGVTIHHSWKDSLLGKGVKGELHKIEVKWSDFRLQKGNDYAEPPVYADSYVVKQTDVVQIELFENSNENYSDTKTLSYSLGDIYEIGELPVIGGSTGDDNPPVEDEENTTTPEVEADVTFTMDVESGKSAGEEVKVTIAAPAGLDNFDMKIKFDDEKLEYVGTQYNSAFMGLSNVTDDEPDAVLLSGTTADPTKPVSAGTLATITFKIKDGVADGEEIALSGTVSAVGVNGENLVGAVQAATLVVGEVEEPEEPEEPTVPVDDNEDTTAPVQDSTDEGNTIVDDTNPNTGAAAPIGAAALAVVAVAAIVALKKRK